MLLASTKVATDVALAFLAMVLAIKFVAVVRHLVFVAVSGPELRYNLEVLHLHLVSTAPVGFGPGLRHLSDGQIEERVLAHVFHPPPSAPTWAQMKTGYLRRAGFREMKLRYALRRPPATRIGRSLRSVSCILLWCFDFVRLAGFSVAALTATADRSGAPYCLGVAVSFLLMACCTAIAFEASVYYSRLGSYGLANHKTYDFVRDPHQPKFMIEVRTLIGAMIVIVLCHTSVIYFLAHHHAHLGLADPSWLDALYSAFMTLLHVGNLAPTDAIGQVVVMVETVTGALILVLSVAGLVSSMGESARHPSS